MSALMCPLSLSRFHAASPPKHVRPPLSVLFPHHLPFYSFHALDTYIQSQKALLARTQSDLDRLRRIRDQAATHPETFFHSFDEKVFSCLQ
jgi:hypothetical protein